MDTTSITIAFDARTRNPNTRGQHTHFAFCASKAKPIFTPWACLHNSASRRPLDRKSTATAEELISGTTPFGYNKLCRPDRSFSPVHTRIKKTRFLASRQYSSFICGRLGNDQLGELRFPPRPVGCVWPEWLPDLKRHLRPAVSRVCTLWVETR